MLRAVSLAILTLLSIVVPAAADPQLADDITVCRDRQSDLKSRLASCEKLLAGGTLTGKDLAIALNVRGNGFMARRDIDKAIIAYNSAVDADPDNAGTLVLRGWAYQHKGQDDQALADYNLALQKRYNFGAAYNDRGTLYLRKGALQSALDDFTSAIKYAPNILVGYTNRARVETLNKDYDAALADFTSAEKIDPNASQLHSNRCITYGVMGRFDEAIADCNFLININPKNQYVMANRADVYLAKGNLDAALKDYNDILALNPNNVRAHVGRGQLFERRRDLTQARADYRSAAVALTKYDDIDVLMARKTAQERVAALTEGGPAAATGRRIALLIGNGAYKNVHPLDNPPRDSKLLADQLKGLGFQTVTLANDLTRDKFFESLKTFATEAEKADWAVIYYAGHGFEVGGVNYLVPVDARLAVDRDRRRRARPPARDPRCLPRQSVCLHHEAYAGTETGRQGLFRHRTVNRLHGGLCGQARRDRTRRPGQGQPVRDRAGA
jgi:tetratricopeptide (TPR) repeat protein